MHCEVRATAVPQRRIYGRSDTSPPFSVYGCQFFNWSSAKLLKNFIVSLRCLPNATTISRLVMEIGSQNERMSD